jgi:hypothetical protein
MGGRAKTPGFGGTPRLSRLSPQPSRVTERAVRGMDGHGFYVEGDLSTSSGKSARRRPKFASPGQAQQHFAKWQRNNVAGGVGAEEGAHARAAGDGGSSMALAAHSATARPAVRVQEGQEGLSEHEQIGGYLPAAAAKTPTKRMDKRRARATGVSPVPIRPYRDAQVVTAAVAKRLGPALTEAVARRGKAAIQLQAVWRGVASRREFRRRAAAAAVRMNSGSSLHCPSSCPSRPWLIAPLRGVSCKRPRRVGFSMCSSTAGRKS